MNNNILIEDIPDNKLITSYKLIKRKLDHIEIFTKDDKDLQSRMKELKKEIKKRKLIKKKIKRNKKEETN